MSHIFIVDAESLEGVQEQLKDAKTRMLKSLNEASIGRLDEPSEGKKDPTRFAIIINGYSLVSNSALTLSLSYRQPVKVQYTNTQINPGYYLRGRVRANAPLFSLLCLGAGKGNGRAYKRGSIEFSLH